MNQNPSSQGSGMNEAMVRQIAAERAARSMTVEKLAAASGIPKSTLIRKLTGQRDLTLREVDLIARGLGMEPDELVRRAWHERREQ